MPDYVKPTHADSRVTIQPQHDGLLLEYQRDPYVFGVSGVYRERAMMPASRLSPADQAELKRLLDLMLDMMSQTILPPPAPPPPPTP